MRGPLPARVGVVCVNQAAAKEMLGRRPESLLRRRSRTVSPRPR